MKRIIFILSIIISFFAWNKYRYFFTGDNKLPTQISLPANQTDPCLGKKSCGIAYIAPWCPACHKIIPHLQNFTKNAAKQTDHGIFIIIGAGTFDQNNSTFKLFNSNAMIDSNSSVAKSLSVSYYPTLLVIDANRKIIMRDQEAFNWMQKLFL